MSDSEWESHVMTLLEDGRMQEFVDEMNAAVGGEMYRLVDGGVTIAESLNVTSDVTEFRRLAREDPAGALKLVRGIPYEGGTAAWMIPMRLELQREIVETAHSACRLDPQHALDHLMQGLVGVPDDVSLWKALLGLAARSLKEDALDDTYKIAVEFFAEDPPSPLPKEIADEYARLKARVSWS